MSKGAKLFPESAWQEAVHSQRLGEIRYGSRAIKDLAFLRPEVESENGREEEHLESTSEATTPFHWKFADLGV